MGPDRLNVQHISACSSASKASSPGMPWACPCLAEPERGSSTFRSCSAPYKHGPACSCIPCCRRALNYSLSLYRTHFCLVSGQSEGGSTLDAYPKVHSQTPYRNFYPVWQVGLAWPVLIHVCIPYLSRSSKQRNLNPFFVSFVLPSSASQDLFHHLKISIPVKRKRKQP